MKRDEILAAIRRAAEELGRAPSRGGLRRITGVSHYRVLAVFQTLREAVRAAGLEPNPKGKKISTEDLLSDWKRVAEKLGRRPSRAEYVREGRYSAGALTVRFGSWSGISTAKDIEKRSGDLVIRTSGDRKTSAATRVTKPEWKQEGRQRESSGLEKPERGMKYGESVLRDFGRVPLAAVPTPLVGMRRVTEAVAQMVVNTLMGSGYWPLVLGQKQNQGFKHNGHEGTQRGTSNSLSARGSYKEDDLSPSLAVNTFPFYSAQGSGFRPPAEEDDRLRRADFPPHHARSARIGDPGFTARGLYKDRPVMGEAFSRSPMTNAPVNELGVMVLFGMVAGPLLGLQVESVQGKFPDCIAKRMVAPGKWQHLRIEFEYESKNFKLHGHDPKGCDVIVCWRHNWKECPAEIEVVELSKLFGMQ